MHKKLISDNSKIIFNYSRLTERYKSSVNCFLSISFTHALLDNVNLDSKKHTLSHRIVHHMFNDKRVVCVLCLLQCKKIISVTRDYALWFLFKIKWNILSLNKLYSSFIFFLLYLMYFFYYFSIYKNNLKHEVFKGFLGICGISFVMFVGDSITFWCVSCTNSIPFIWAAISQFHWKI